MPVVSLVWALVAFAGLVITLLPPLQPLNWIILPLSGLALLLNAYILFAPKTRSNPLGIAGFMTAGVTFIIALVRVTINPGQI